MPAIRSIALIVAIFAIAVALGLWIHPVMSLLFLVLAKVVEILWSRGAPAFREAYDQTMAQEKPKRRLQHLLADDGETLEVIFAEDEPDDMAGKRYD